MSLPTEDKESSCRMKYRTCRISQAVMGPREGLGYPETALPKREPPPGCKGYWRPHLTRELHPSPALRLNFCIYTRIFRRSRNTFNGEEFKENLRILVRPRRGGCWTLPRGSSSPPRAALERGGWGEQFYFLCFPAMGSTCPSPCCLYSQHPWEVGTSLSSFAYKKKWTSCWGQRVEAAQNLIFLNPVSRNSHLCLLNIICFYPWPRNIYLKFQSPVVLFQQRTGSHLTCLGGVRVVGVASSQGPLCLPVSVHPLP